MTQPKPASPRDSAPEETTPPASQPGQPLPFTPSKGAAPHSAGREAAPQTPTGAQQPAQPIQFTPARTPAPSPQAPPSSPQPPAAETPPIVVKRKRRVSRFVMLVVVPLVALTLGFTWWLSSGRYVSTDNAYVGADKSLITPQVTGAIVAVHVVEGQKVKVGDPLFDIDPKPYEIALALAKGKRDAAKIEFANLKSSYLSNVDQIKMGQDAVRVRQADFDRKNDLAISRSGTAADRDTSMANLIQAKQILEFVKWQQATVKVKLGGGPDTTIDQFPDYMQATAAVDDAERNLQNTKVLAPIDGVATQVPEIELGRVAAAGQPVFAIVANTGPLGRRQPEGIGPDLRSCWPARDGQRRHVSRPGMERNDLLDRAGHRGAIRDPAAAERERQLGESRPAHPAQVLLRSEGGHDGLKSGHERLCDHRHGPGAHARRHARRAQAVGGRLRRHPSGGAHRRHPMNAQAPAPAALRDDLADAQVAARPSAS